MNLALRNRLWAHVPLGPRRSLTDIALARVEHLLAAPLWFMLAVGVGQSLPVPGDESLAWLVGGWSLIAVLPLTWLCLLGLLVVWWRQGRGPLWSYPLRWVVMLFLTFVALVALLFPPVRAALIPARTDD